jgi:hypothetical protein
MSSDETACPQGHPLREVARLPREETVEEVVHVRRRVKQFNREGSEHWTEMEVPEFIERIVRFVEVSYRCDTCGADVRRRLP